MNVKATNKVETNRYELELEVSPEEFNEAINTVYQAGKQEDEHSRIRKGHAPGRLSKNIMAKRSFTRPLSTTCTAPW